MSGVTLSPVVLYMKRLLSARYVICLKEFCVNRFSARRLGYCCVVASRFLFLFSLFSLRARSLLRVLSDRTHTQTHTHAHANRIHTYAHCGAVSFSRSPCQLCPCERNGTGNDFFSLCSHCESDAVRVYGWLVCEC